MKKRLFILVLALLPAFTYAGSPVDTAINQQMTRAVTAFIQSLDGTQQKDLMLPYTDPARFDWHFTPRPRKGITFKQMNAAQRKAAMAVVQVVLSQEGYSKAEQIIDLENVLRVVESRPANDTYRDPENYAFLVFGKPGPEPWGWRMEGHHLSLHFSSIKGQVTYTPSFFGSNPGKVLADVLQKGKVILKKEQDNAFALLHALDATQMQKANLGSKAPFEIFTSNSRKAVLEKMEGLPMSEMNAAQKALFKTLIQTYLERYHVTLKNQQWSALEKAGLDKIHFAWLGDQQPEIGEGHGHYYRIHGPTFLIEFDNTQNGGNHIHSVVRDLTNDFGEDLLRKHYEAGHKE